MELQLQKPHFHKSPAWKLDLCKTAAVLLIKCSDRPPTIRSSVLVDAQHLLGGWALQSSGQLELLFGLCLPAPAACA